MPLYDNWTWDSVNRIMTIVADDVKGYDEAHAFSFSDIPDCIVAKGWNASYNESASGIQLEFQFRIVIGNGTTTTWFVDTDKSVSFRSGSVTGASQSLIEVKANGNFRVGVLEDATKKLTRYGVNFLSLESTSTTYWITATTTNAKAYLYSSNFLAGTTALRFIRLGYSGFDAPIYNCYFERTSIIASRLDLYNVDMTNRGLEDFRGGTLEQVKIWSADIAFLPYLNRPMTIKNAIVRATTYLFYPYVTTVNHYAINVDADAWTFYWGWGGTSTGKIYRQYEFDSHVQDKNGDVLSGVSVVGECISPYGQAFSVTTDANGDIPTQTVDRSWYQQSTGNTENMKTPLKVTYKKADYQTVVKYYPMTEKTKDRVVLQKAVDTVFVDGKPALNLSESDPENELYAVI